MNDGKRMLSVARFGAFEVAFKSREIRKRGMRIQLEEKPFQILELLVENAGQVVNRKALCEKLWPDTFVAFNHNLNTAVNKLRSVLGDTAHSQRFIQTLPRAGYRFIAPVERPSSDGFAATVQTASASSTGLENGAEQQAHRVVTEKSVPHSSRPQRALGQPLQAKSCQSAR